MLANSQFLAVDQRPKKATVSTILLMHAVGVSVDQRHLFEARNISFPLKNQSKMQKSWFLMKNTTTKIGYNTT